VNGKLGDLAVPLVVVVSKNGQEELLLMHLKEGLLVELLNKVPLAIPNPVQPIVS